MASPSCTCNSPTARRRSCSLPTNRAILVVGDIAEALPRRLQTVVACKRKAPATYPTTPTS